MRTGSVGKLPATFAEVESSDFYRVLRTLVPVLCFLSLYKSGSRIYYFYSFVFPRLCGGGSRPVRARGLKLAEFQLIDI